MSGRTTTPAPPARPEEASAAEARAVGRRQLQELGRGAAAQRREREVGGEVGRAGVGVEAHARS